jgi:hypothetical protein
MKILIVSLALTVNLAVYWLFAAKSKSWFNVLTPQYLIGIPTIYVFELIQLFYVGSEGSDLGYLIVYTAYVLPNIAFTAGYLYVKPPQILLREAPSVSYSSMLPLGIMLVAVALYVPVMRQFADDLLNPRAIYIATRTGFGMEYFGSITLCYVSVIVALFAPRTGMLAKVVAVATALFFAYLHGSKGHMITVVFIVMLYAAVVAQVRLRFVGFLVLALIFSAAGAAVFISMTTGVEMEDMLLLMTGYSDYSRNAVMLIDSIHEFHFGTVLFEDNFFSRIPRALFPAKPKDFGSFALALEYFPHAFYQDQGVPSFGVGTLYADFGVFMLPGMALVALLEGMCTSALVTKLRKYRHPGDFVVMCFLCGAEIIPIGSGYLLPEHIFIAILIYWLCRVRRMVPEVSAVMNGSTKREDENNERNG